MIYGPHFAWAATLEIKYKTELSGSQEFPVKIDLLKN